MLEKRGISVNNGQSEDNFAFSVGGLGSCCHLSTQRDNEA